MSVRNLNLRPGVEAGAPARRRRPPRPANASTQSGRKRKSETRLRRFFRDFYATDFGWSLSFSLFIYVCTVIVAIIAVLFYDLDAKKGFDACIGMIFICALTFVLGMTLEIPITKSQ